jgi:hypothetical protein
MFPRFVTWKENDNFKCYYYLTISEIIYTFSFIFLQSTYVLLSFSQNTKAAFKPYLSLKPYKNIRYAYRVINLRDSVSDGRQYVFLPLILIYMLKITDPWKFKFILCSKATRNSFLLIVRSLELASKVTQVSEWQWPLLDHTAACRMRNQTAFPLPAHNTTQ